MSQSLLKYVKVLQGFILSQMKLLAVKRIYFHDNIHFNNRGSPVNRMQKQTLEKNSLKKFPNIVKI